MAKPINKSIRLSEEVYNYIESYPGDGFNNKLEAVVLLALKNEDTLKERIRYQQDRLDKLFDDSRALQKKYQQLNEMLYTALQLNSTFKKLYEDIQKIKEG